MVNNDRMGIMAELKKYKADSGAIKHEVLLSIPKSQRLPELAKKDFLGIMGLITAYLTLAFEGMNLKRPMNKNQILDLGETILDSSTEDNLAMEDLMLFLQKLNRGEYGAMYESMDIPKFMLTFETYRQERYEALQCIRLNQHLESKSLGDANRTVEKSELEEKMYNLGSRLEEMKAKLRDVTKENKKLREIDKF